MATLQPVLTDGHLAMARSVGAGEYALALNQFVNLSENVKIAGSPIEVFALDPVALFFGEVGISALAPHPNAAKLAANFMLSQECQQFLAKFGRIPTRAGRRLQPARHRRADAEEEGRHRAADARTTSANGSAPSIRCSRRGRRIYA